MRLSLAFAALLLAVGCETQQQVAPKPMIPFVETPTNVHFAEVASIFINTCLAHLREYPDFEQLEERFSNFGFRVTDKSFDLTKMVNVSDDLEVEFGRYQDHGDRFDGGVELFPPVDYCSVSGAANDLDSLSPEMLSSTLLLEFGPNQDVGSEFYFRANRVQQDLYFQVDVLTYILRGDLEFRPREFPRECVNLQECEVRRLKIDLRSQQSDSNE